MGLRIPVSPEPELNQSDLTDLNPGGISYWRGGISYKNGT